MAFIPFILFVVVWIFTYKHFISKQKGKFISHFLGFIISFLIFIISLAIIAPISTPNLEQIEIKDEPKQIQKEDIKGPSNTITTKLTFDVINSLKNNYGIEAGIFEDMPLYYDKLCSTDKACQIYAGKIQIQVIYKSVIVNPSSRVAPKDYLEACSASFISLTNANKDLAESIITQGFNYASKNGSVKSETLGVEFKVVPDNMTGLLKCEFLKP